MTKFIDTVKELMSLRNKDDEDFDSYRSVIHTLNTRANGKPARECSDVECLAYDIHHVLGFADEDGWVREGKVCFSRDELYDMMEAGLIHEPCRSEDGYAYFRLTDE